MSAARRRHWRRSCQRASPSLQNNVKRSSTRAFLRVPGVIPADAAAAMADRIWEALASQIGALPDRPDTWKAQGLVHPPVNFRDLLGAPRRLRRGAGASDLARAARRFLRRARLGRDLVEAGTAAARSGLPDPERAWNVPTSALAHRWRSIRRNGRTRCVSSPAWRQARTRRGRDLLRRRLSPRRCPRHRRGCAWRRGARSARPPSSSGSKHRARGWPI